MTKLSDVFPDGMLVRCDGAIFTEPVTNKPKQTAEAILAIDEDVDALIESREPAYPPELVCTVGELKALAKSWLEVRELVVKMQAVNKELQELR